VTIAQQPRGLIVFDLDGTLIRGPSVCEIFAAHLGRLEAQQGFEKLQSLAELSEARREMARWYSAVARSALVELLTEAPLAPKTRKGMALLRAQGVECAIASITWEFGVAWFAGQLGVRHYLGTRLGDAGEITHVWPDLGDRALALAGRARRSRRGGRRFVARRADARGGVAALLRG
jgi:phosphoserine phosphatase